MVITTTAVRDLTPAQYAIIFRNHELQSDLPSVEELIEWRIARLTNLSLATETELRVLAGHITDRSFAFVPAWPNPLNFERWMAFVKYRERNGVSHLSPDVVEDVVTVPKGPFVMLNIDDGWSWRDVPRRKKRESFQAGLSVPFTVRMGVSYLGDNPYAVDSSYGMDLVGSRYNAVYFPNLAVTEDRLTLCSDLWTRTADGWGAPSCGRVVGLDLKSCGS
jgi:hypothetical protein